MEIIKRNRFFLFWSGIGVLALGTVALLPWRFQVNDDVMMMWLVSGAYTGTPEPYAIFIHPFLSWGFSKVYSIFPSFQWYESLWLFTIYLSFTLLIYRISKINTSQLTFGLLAFFLLLISIHFGIFPQFTYVAGFAAFAALVILDHKESSLFNGLAFVLLALGTMIRWEAAGLILLGYFFFIFLSEKKTWNFGFLRNLSHIIFLFIIIIGSKFIYELDSPYTDFLRFNRLRAAVIDHPVFYEEMEQKQISKGSELFFFSRWYFEDSGITEVDLREKKRDLDAKLWSIQHMLDSFVRFWRFQKMEAFKSFLIFGIFGIFFLAFKKSPFLLFFLGGWILFFLFFNHFYLIHGRINILVFICFLFPVFRFGMIQLERKWVATISLLFLMALGFHFHNFLKEAELRATLDTEFTDLRNSLNSSTHLIVEGYPEQKWRHKFSVLNPVPFISTGWISRSVFQKKALNRMNLSSFADIQEFALITPISNTEIVFPDYMNYAFGNFIQTDSIRSNNFILLQFKKKANENY